MSQPSDYTIKSFVQDTSDQLRKLKSLKYTKYESLDRFDIDPSYLKVLGLLPDQKLAPNASLVVTTACSSKDYRNLPSFLSSVYEHFGKPSLFPLVIYGIGLNSEQLVESQRICNSSTNCALRIFEEDKFPSHVHNIRLKAFKAVTIQLLLLEFAMVLWLDVNMVLLSANISQFVENARRFGVASCTVQTHTSALTHPKLYWYFNTKEELFYFRPLVRTDVLLISGSRFVLKNIMLPWIKCSLTEACLEPPGSQTVGCHFHRKPLFIYTGCHKYEQSAFSMVVGLAFNDTSFYRLPEFCDIAILASEIEQYSSTSEPVTSSHFDLHSHFKIVVANTQMK